MRVRRSWPPKRRAWWNEYRERQGRAPRERIHHRRDRAWRWWARGVCRELIDLGRNDPLQPQGWTMTEVYRMMRPRKMLSGLVYVPGRGRPLQAKDRRVKQ